MTPAAQYGAANDVLDRIIAGQAAEPALQGWARQNRYAGSKDRAAIRDHVFDVLRRKRSTAAMGGGDDGRAMIIGLLRQQGKALDAVFGAGGYAPEGLTEGESNAPLIANDDPAIWDLPDSILDTWKADLGEHAFAVAQIMRDRAPITLRVNQSKSNIAAVVAALADEAIIAAPINGSPTALKVTENARKLRNCEAFKDGLFEFQDLASQQAVQALPLFDGARVLDYCAGGGGKALAIMDCANVEVVAHDIDAKRTRDIAPRAVRAGVEIDIADTETLDAMGDFDVVFCDAPCSGAGTWRRSPEAKWAINQGKLSDFNRLQIEVIENAARFVASGGVLTYATCSVFTVENAAVIEAFLNSQGGKFVLETDNLRLPDGNGDGFYYAHLRKA